MHRIKKADSNGYTLESICRGGDSVRWIMTLMPDRPCCFNNTFSGFKSQWMIRLRDKASRHCKMLWANFLTNATENPVKRFLRISSYRFMESWGSGEGVVKEWRGSSEGVVRVRWGSGKRVVRVWWGWDEGVVREWWESS